MRIKLGGRNYKRGSAFEWRWLDGLFKDKKAIRGARFLDQLALDGNQIIVG